MRSRTLYLLLVGVLAMATVAIAQNGWELEYETSQDQWEFESEEDYDNYGYEDYGYDDYGNGDYYDEYEADAQYEFEVERQDDELLVEGDPYPDDSYWDSYNGSGDHYYTDDWYETEDAFSEWYDEPEGWQS